ncbi:preQ(1) synthase [Ferrimicrobium sp.]|uniref:preQ(1) synthase n=1 Tax=Ferrimicrobium sp. TaxID=2926050 RepID=UPI00260A9D8B|nr:preQ(1) synthase [Ferrimicrobium sp.]
MTEDGLTQLGAPTSYRYQDPDPAMLEAFENPHPGTDFVIRLVANEFTSLCPITGQPDYGQLVIDYIPARLCVESKSLKLYLVSYRNHGSFHESCVNAIADDLNNLLSPKFLRVFGDFNPRGGIAIKPMVERLAPDVSREHAVALIASYTQVTTSR